MAENIPIKPHKSTTEKVKLPNVVARTTSETLRINETDQNSIPVVGLPPNVITNSRKKPCSFQITSVIVGRSNDGGDDSADDLDDISHADDISDMVDASRITDNETPSLSEDTISKEDIYYNVSGPMSLCSAPVIPTSSQYGLVIVSPGNGADATGTTPSTCGSTTAPISSIPFTVQAGRPPEHIIIHAEQCPNKSSAATEHDHVVGKEGSQPVRADRFKVVKIESTEPFKRGRWTCMDFLDSANTPFGGAPSQTSTTVINASPNAHPQAAQSLPQIPQGVVLQSNQSQVPYYPTQQPGMSQQFQPVQQSAPSSMPQQQYAGQMPSSMMAAAAASYPVQQQQNVVQPQAQQTQPQAQSQVPVTISSSVQQPVYNNSTNRFPTYTGQPPKTSNTNSVPNQYGNPVINNSQSYVATSMGSQPTYMPQGQTYSGQLAQAIAGNIPPAQQGQTYAGHASVNAQTNNYLPKTSYSQSANQYPQQSQSSVSTAGGQQFQYVNQPVYGQQPAYSVNIPSSPVSVPQQAPSYPTGQAQSAGDMPQQQQSYVPTSEQFQPGIATFSIAQPQQPQSVSTYVQPTAVQPSEEGASGITPMPGNIESSRDMAAVATEEGQSNAPLPDEADTAAGNSAVAIDNKIEQAMDLVKSHLMFAVREEVEVLKERISELMDRINQLETENSILKANASQETLAQLATPMVAAGSQVNGPSSQSQSPAGGQPPTQPQTQPPQAQAQQSAAAATPNASAVTQQPAQQTQQGMQNAQANANAAAATQPVSTHSQQSSQQ